MAGFNGTLREAGCAPKDPRHWCNSHVNGSSPPSPSPGPPGPPGPGPPGALPCSLSPCLYDISRDPLEQHDVSATEPQQLATMLARLRELHKGVVPSPFSGGHEVRERFALIPRPSMRAVNP